MAFLQNQAIFMQYLEFYGIGYNDICSGYTNLLEEKYSKA